jgi:hypothetical protein
MEGIGTGGEPARSQGQGTASNPACNRLRGGIGLNGQHLEAILFLPARRGGQGI